MENEMTTIRISRHNKNRLSAFGKQPDTINDVLAKVLVIAEEIKSERLIEEKMVE